MTSTMAQASIALSLFSGAGGMDIGIRKAGFSVLACVERDRFCCENLRVNITRERLEKRIIEEDIRNVDPLTFMKELGLAPGELDLLFGGPPRQAFSQNRQIANSVPPLLAEHLGRAIIASLQDSRTCTVCD